MRHHLTVSRTARYYTMGGGNPSAVGEVWFVLHGYGQLAEQFISIFEVLDDGSRMIVAPEALNRFYLVGPEAAPAAERPVGATWMTREDRENEIDDYVGYLDQVAAAVMEGLPGRSAMPRLILLGFSQGAATAARWVARGNLHPAHVVLWGALLPPEVTPTANDPLQRASLHVVIGSRDRFLSAERIAEEERRLRDAGVPIRLTRYPGGHGMAKDALRELARSLRTET